MNIMDPTDPEPFKNGLDDLFVLVNLVCGSALCEYGGNLVVILLEENNWKVW